MLVPAISYCNEVYYPIVKYISLAFFIPSIPVVFITSLVRISEFIDYKFLLWHLLWALAFSYLYSCFIYFVYQKIKKRIRWNARKPNALSARKR